jgi:hypothetical protein
VCRATLTAKWQQATNPPAGDGMNDELDGLFFDFVCTYNVIS